MDDPASRENPLDAPLPTISGNTVMVAPDEGTVLPGGIAGQRAKPLDVSPGRQAMARFWRDWRAWASLGVLGFFVLLALVGPLIYQRIGGPYTSGIDGVVYGPAAYHTYNHEELDRQHELPSAQYWLGTDEIGRDILARLMEGMLISLVLAVSVEVFDIGLGVLIGVLAGYYGGWIDQFLARFTDIVFAFPDLLFLIMVAGIYGNLADSLFGKIPVIGPAGGGRLLILFFSLSLFAWPTMARLVRGQTLQLKEQQFIEAARTSGTSNIKIMLRHIVPNLFSLVVIAATLSMAGTVTAEAGISLLGLGIQPPGASIGLMIASAAPYTAVSPWEILVPITVLTLVVLAFSFLGDALRDAFDPH